MLFVFWQVCQNVSAMRWADRVWTPSHTRHVVLLDESDTTNRQAWECVRHQFVSMGATRVQILEAERCMRHDTSFYHKWVSSLPLWCPSIAVYQKKKDD